MNTKHKFYLLIPLMYLFISGFLYSQNDSIMILDAKGSYELSDIDYSPDGTRIAAGYYQRIIIWDAITGIPIDTINNEDCRNFTVRYSHDGSMIICPCDTTPQLWDANTGELIKTFPRSNLEELFLLGVSFSHDDKKIVGYLSDSTVATWDVKSGGLISRFRAHARTIYDAVFTLNDSRIISCGMDSVIRIWDANTYKLLENIKGHNGGVTSLAISPDGSKFASCSFDSTIKLWDIETGELIRTFYGHKNIVSSVDFSPNGTKLLSGCLDKTVKLWDVTSGELLHTFVGHNTIVVCVRYSPDSLSVASAGFNEKIIIWKVPAITDVVEQDYPSEEDLIITPNPTTDYVEVTLSNHTLKGVVESVKVFNVLGVCVITSPPAPLHSGEGSKVRLNVSHLPPGVYFVQSGSRVQRFVKM